MSLTTTIVFTCTILYGIPLMSYGMMYYYQPVGEKEKNKNTTTTADWDWHEIYNSDNVYGYSDVLSQGWIGP